ncbi:hypothetical protein D3C80_1800810 [compost metagenome]
MVAPGQCAVATHGRDQLVLVVEQGGHHRRATGHVGRGVFERQGHRLFFGQYETALVVNHVARRRLGIEPFTDQPRVAAGLCRECFGRGRLAVGHRPVQPEFVTQDDIG